MSKKKEIEIIIILLSAVLVFSLAFTFTSDYYDDKNKKIGYEQIFIEQLNIHPNGVPLSQIFDFDFDRAYVFDEPYLSGSGFTQHYNLDLSIEEVESGESDGVYRIVFVDRDGNFIYLFEYGGSHLFTEDEGMVVYPSTIVRKCESEHEGQTRYEFLDVKDSDYYNPERIPESQ